MDHMLQYVIDHPDLEPCTYESVAERFEEPPGGTVDRSTLIAVAKHAARGELRAAELGGTSFSVADQFGVLNHAVAHADNRTLPGTAPLRRLLGPTGDAAGNADPFAASPASVIQAALDVERDLHRHVPATIPVGPHHAKPGTFLQGLAQLVASTAAGTPTDPIPFDPAPPLPAEAELEGLRDLTWHNRWDIFPPDFTGATLQRHAKRQTWTIRPAVARP